ncbi:MAG: hypothetical protein M1820_010226 [Bogoriella megaspora]|nr:MAG: hypothetical protein M1820_010226 [Bogoriella megaspora]
MLLHPFRRRTATTQPCLSLYLTSAPQPALRHILKPLQPLRHLPHSPPSLLSTTRQKTMSTQAPPPPKELYFANFEVSHQHFHTSSTGLSHALVNLRPLLPGHTLIIPTRTSAVHLSDLTPEERNDLFATVIRVQKTLKRVYSGDATPSEAIQGQRHDRHAEERPKEGGGGKGRLRQALRPKGRVTAFNVATQDGVAAGQTVPHVHVHIIPRRGGDLEEYGGGDVLYQWLEGEEGDVGAAQEAVKEKEKGKEGGERKDGFVPESERRDRSLADMKAEADWLRAEMERDGDGE